MRFARMRNCWRPYSLSLRLVLLRARVCAAEGFLVAYLRYFVRVDGVRARVLDTRFLVRRGAPDTLLRQCTWREGPWSALVDIPATPGRGEEPARIRVSLTAINDSVAAQRLPLTRPAVVEAMQLKPVPPPVPAVELLWARADTRCEALSASPSGLVVAVTREPVGSNCVHTPPKYVCQSLSLNTHASSHPPMRHSKRS